MGKATYRQEYVRCGKASCRKCPHGPYWYAYWHDDGGKLRKRYLGKKSPFQTDDESEPIPANRLDEIFNKRTASLKLAKEILGINCLDNYAGCKSAFRRLVLGNHPDRGGDEMACKRITAAWAYVCEHQAWVWGNIT